jgi:hypothetical protein
MITELKDNEIIVVGTNMYGNHAGGAAAQAASVSALVADHSQVC